MAAGRLEQADASWTGVADSARAAGELETLRLAVALRAMVRLRQGRVAEAEADLRELIAWVGELGLPLRRLPDRAAVGDRAARRRADRARRARRGAALGGADRASSATGPRSSASRSCSTASRGCGSRRAARRRRSSSPASARAASAPGASATPGFLAWRLDARRRARRDRPHRGGARRRATSRPTSRARFGVAREHGMALLALGRITGDAETLRAAAEVLGRLAGAARARPRAGRASAPRERGAARRRSSSAERSCGATALAAPRPRRAGRRPAPSRAARALTGAAALTAAQQRVARLAAGGLGNREIAERLFVTEKTVEGHLGAAYRKLGISSRSQLDAALQTDP